MHYRVHAMESRGRHCSLVYFVCHTYAHTHMCMIKSMFSWPTAILSVQMTRSLYITIVFYSLRLSTIIIAVWIVSPGQMEVYTCIIKVSRKKVAASVKKEEANCVLINTKYEQYLNQEVRNRLYVACIWKCRTIYCQVILVQILKREQLIIKTFRKNWVDVGMRDWKVYTQKQDMILGNGWYGPVPLYCSSHCICI